MKIWTSSETSSGLGKGPGSILLDIENSFNSELSDKNYGSGIIEFTYIAIILGKEFDIYDEIKKFHKKKKELEFRLKVNYSDFRNASEEEKYNLLFLSILLAIDESKKFNISSYDQASLRSDFVELGVRYKWTSPSKVQSVVE